MPSLYHVIWMGGHGPLQHLLPCDFWHEREVASCNDFQTEIRSQWQLQKSVPTQWVTKGNAAQSLGLQALTPRCFYPRAFCQSRNPAIPPFFALPKPPAHSTGLWTSHLGTGKPKVKYRQSEQGYSLLLGIQEPELVMYRETPGPFESCYDFKEPSYNTPSVDSLSLPKGSCP